MSKITPVILSGGSGTRLWPLSRKMYPKQFLNLYGDSFSMLQETIRRLDGLEQNPPVVVCNEAHRFIVAEQLRQLGIDDPTIILEPEGKNTAPAIALAALVEQERNGSDSILLVLAADHVITDKDTFKLAVTKALLAAEEHSLVTFGIVPDRPETGYGYIKFEREEGKELYPVIRFVEKPDQELAREYVDSGSYLWNSGMFMFSAGVYLDELKKFQPEIESCSRMAVSGSTRDLDFIRVDPQAFHQCPSNSIDYAVMEHTGRALLIPLDAGWNDIGSWASLWSVNEKDPNGNSVHGDSLVIDARDNLIMGETRLVAAVGVDDLIIIETRDAVLVADKKKSQEVKKIVDQLQEQGREEANFHRIVYRPWGCFDSIEEGPRFKVKRITVKPGAKLSLQMHHHRAEHWVIVSGTAKVHRDGEEVLLSENESIYIHVGQKHSLENPGKLPLELIEIQTGSYLGEDDIIRFDDLYGRSASQ